VFTYCNTTNIAITDDIVNDCLSAALVNYTVLICNLDKKSGVERMGRGLSWGVLGAGCFWGCCWEVGAGL
jgi:hypothetical protein